MSKSTDNKMDPSSPGARLLEDIISPLSSRVPLPLDRHSGTEIYRQHSNKEEKEKMQNPKVKRYGSGAATSSSRRTANGYMPIEDYGLIGNMRTTAMVALDGGLDYMCWPYFDSPSVFCRILDKEKGGHFTIGPTSEDLCTTKQQYLPASNILQTRYLKEEGVMNVVDFFPRPNNRNLDDEYHAHVVKSEHTGKVPERPDLKKWLVRRVECMRGSVDVSVEVMPAFNYAQDKHTTEIADLGQTEQGHGLQRVTFRSKDLALELNATIDCGDEPEKTCPRVKFEKTPEAHNLGDGVTATFTLTEGQAVSFILRDAEDHSPDIIETKQVDELQLSTHRYWARWIQQSEYTGRWEEVVTRSLLLLKMLTFEPSGAIVAAPTFSLPEDFGGMFPVHHAYCAVKVFTELCRHVLSTKTL
jgi:GH15 family glucan-1,4-alpha-glucosidase